MRKLILIITAMIALSGCTDATFDSVMSYGDSADIVCYSGGQKIFEAKSTGKVMALDGGWAFRSTTGEYVQTFADCFVSVK